MMLIIVAIFLALTVLAWGQNPAWLAIVYLAAAALTYFLRRGMTRNLDQIFKSDYLWHVAEELERILRPDHTVRYVVLGHCHRATLERLGKRTWYVNTGAWAPVYKEEWPIEKREELTFFRLAWGYEGTPELLRWDDATGAPTRTVLWQDAGQM